jgi:hypothetical protein
LLRYLTWNETNTAIIVFVRQPKFKEVLAKAFAEAKSHPNFLDDLNNTAENWFNFRFHLGEDEACTIKMAMQFFHLP